jgi:hypothetical protein
MDQHTDIGFLSVFFVSDFNEKFPDQIFEGFKGFVTIEIRLKLGASSQLECWNSGILGTQ